MATVAPRLAPTKAPPITGPPPPPPRGVAIGEARLGRAPAPPPRGAAAGAGPDPSIAKAPGGVGPIGGPRVILVPTLGGASPPGAPCVRKERIDPYPGGRAPVPEDGQDKVTLVGPAPPSGALVAPGRIMAAPVVQVPRPINVVHKRPPRVARAPALQKGPQDG